MADIISENVNDTISLHVKPSLDTFNYWSNTEKGKIAEECINRIDPFEISCWILLIKEAETRPMEESRPFFKRAMEQFPTCSTFLKIYIRKEIAEGIPSHIEQLFGKYLNDCKDVELYELYISYLKNKYNSSQEYFETIKKAYQTAIKSTGLDYNACSLWNDYICYLKSNVEQGSYNEIQKIKELRELYQEAIQIPMNNLDVIWKDYTSFEQSISRVNSDKILGEKIKDFTTSKRIAKDCEIMTKGLLLNTIPLPPQNTPSEQKQKSLWIQWITWEKNNPLGLEDVALLIKRVMYVSEHYLMNFCFHPMAWCETLHYLQHYCWKLIESGDKIAGNALMEQTRQLYLKGICEKKPMCYDYLVNFSYAEFERSCNNNNIADQTYEKLLKIPSIDHSLVYINYMKHSKAVYGIKEARNIFNRARQDPNINYEVFVAAANMEYFENQSSDVSTKIYDIGLKRFATCRPFIESFLFHLTRLSDTFNIRLIFERILKLCDDSDKALVLLNYHRHVACIGDVHCVLNIEKRILDLFENKILDEYYLKGIMSNKYCHTSMCTPILNNNFKNISLFDSNFVKDKSDDKNRHHQIYNQNKSHTLYSSKNSELSIMPDISQMRPFKPIPNDSKPPFATPQIIPGGLFDAQPVVHELLDLLPSFESWGNRIHLDIPLLFTYIENINSDIFSQDKFISSEPNNPAQHTFTKRINLQKLNNNNDNDNAGGKAESITNVLNDVYQARLNKKLSA